MERCGCKTASLAELVKILMLVPQHIDHPDWCTSVFVWVFCMICASEVVRSFVEAKIGPSALGIFAEFRHRLALVETRDAA